MKKTLFAFMLIAIALLFVACGTTSVAVPTTTPLIDSTNTLATIQPNDSPIDSQFDYFTNKELKGAISLGLIDETSILSDSMTAQAFLDLLQKSIAMMDGNPDVLLSNVSPAADMQDNISRADAAIGFYWAARAMGIDTRYANEAGKYTFDNWDGAESKLFVEFDSVFYCDDYCENANSGLVCATWFVSAQGSLISNRPIMNCDEKGRFHIAEDLTMLDAIVGTWRLITSIEPEPEYASIEEASKLPYDNSIITDELLAKDNDLPNLSYAEIPVYTAMCYLEKSSSYNNCGTGWFTEDAIRSDAKAGINFLSVRYDFSVLNYPDYESGQINLYELRQLDQLIAWGIQYGVHICIESNGLINQGGYPRGLHRYDMGIQNEQLNRLNSGDSTLQRDFKACWELIASRYASIPSKFLSFNLLVEPSSPSEQVYVDTFLPVAEAIRSYNNDRVVFAYGNVGSNCPGLAAYGYPLTWSIFYPDVYTQVNHDEDGRPVYDHTWRSWFLNGSMGYDADGPKSIVINMETDVKSADFYINSASSFVWEPTYNQSSKYAIYADDVAIDKGTVTQTDAWKCVSIAVPEGTKTLTLKSMSSGGYITCDGIILNKSDSTQIKIVPTTYDYPSESVPSATVTVAADGSVSSDIPMTFDLLLAQDNLSYYLQIAKENNVGIMVAEWAPVQSSRTDTDALTYYALLAEGFRNLGITAAPSRSPGFSFSCLMHKGALSEDFVANPDRYVYVGDGSEYYIDTWEVEALTGHPFVE